MSTPSTWLNVRTPGCARESCNKAAVLRHVVGEGILITIRAKCHQMLTALTCRCRACPSAVEHDPVSVPIERAAEVSLLSASAARSAWPSPCQLHEITATAIVEARWAVLAGLRQRSSVA